MVRDLQKAVAISAYGSDMSLDSVQLLCNNASSHDEPICD